MPAATKSTHSISRRTGTASSSTTRLSKSSNSYALSSSNNHNNTNSNDDAILLATANALLHPRDKYGRTPIHRLAISSSFPTIHNVKEANTLLQHSMRVDEAEHFSSSATTEQHQFVHTKHMLIAQDLENGYSALHRAIYEKNIKMVLLLLRYIHVVMEGGIDHYHHRHGNLSTTAAATTLMTDTMIFSPSSYMSFLENDYHHGANSSNANSTSSFPPSVSNDVTTSPIAIKDFEGFTPLRLLGELYVSNLQQTLDHILYLRDMTAAMKRSSSIGEYEPHHHSIGSSRGSRTRRSNSFLLEEDVEEEEMEHANDLNVRFSQYHFNSGERNVSMARGIRRRRCQTKNEELEFGTEVVTFGKTNHCALGHFKSGSSSSLNHKKGHAGGGGGGNGKGGSGSMVGRVNEFAMSRGRCEREHYGIDHEERRGEEHNDNDNDGNNAGYAVAVVAAAHHTLVATSHGYLYVFGLGKGGRLGTGDEQHRPFPVRILGALSRRLVTSIAAAENHSLCTTNDGNVYGWGSNRFGQLGVVGGGKCGNNNMAIPTKIDDLRREQIIKVAAGDRHSVALSKDGEVFCWGDNRAGQLGRSLSRSSSSHHGTSSSSSSNATATTPLTNHHNGVSRVDALWSCNPRRVAMDIAAAEKSTLVLTHPPVSQQVNTSRSLRWTSVNAVYSWGHGNCTPIKINFPAHSPPSSSSRQQAKSSSNTNQSKIRPNACSIVNPTGIACAKYHNVAITSDGRVYTWGLHAEPLARDSPNTTATNHPTNNNNNSRRSRSRSDSLLSSDHNNRTPPPPPSSSAAKCTNSNYIITTPQLVTTILPSQGGGRAIAVSASENHTAVITDAGHLYTWGATYGNDVLGHSGVRYQPCPKRVEGVFRAVLVAAAREHTVLILGVTLPKLPSLNTRSIKVGSDEDEGCSQSNDNTIPKSGHGGTFAEQLHLQPSNYAHHHTRVPSLQRLAERKVAQHIDLYNIIPIYITAERIQSTSLLQFCHQFVRLNLDGVLAVAKKNELDTLLDEGLMELQIDYEFNHHDDENRDDWTVAGAIASISKLVKERGGSFCQSNTTATTSQLAEHYHHNHNSPNKLSDARLRSNSVTKTSTITIDPSFPMHAPTTSTKRTMCSEQAARLTARFDIDMSNPNQVSTRYESLSKLMRSLKKKLNQVSELEEQVEEEGVEELTMEQREKLARRPLLEADLAVIQPALEEVEWKMVHLNLVDTNTKKVASSFSVAPPPQSIEKEKEASVVKKEFSPAKPTNDIKSNNKKPAKDATTPSPPTKCRCNVCNITCPDESSLALHMSGKRHKNQLRRLKEDEEKETAANMMEMKRRQMIKNDLNPASPTATTATTKRGTKKVEYPKNKKGSVWPKYSLAPPPPPCRKTVPSKQDANHDRKKNMSVSSFQKILQEEEEAKIKTKVEKRSLNKCTKNEKRHLLVNSTPPKTPWTPPLNKNNKLSKECQNQQQHEFMDMLPLGWSVKPSSSGTTTSSKAATLLRNTTSPPPAASPCYNTKTSTTTQSSPTASSFSLSSFLNKQPSPSPHKKKQPPLRKTAPVAPWSNTAQTTPPPPLPHPNSFPSNTTAVDNTNASFQPTKQQQQQPKPRRISFEQVLKNEQILKEKEGTHGVVLSEAKWYLERRERACSIGKIQEIEIEEQKMRDLIEEQREIEKMIAKEAQEKKEIDQQEKKEKKRRRRKNKNNKTKDSGGGDGGEGGNVQSRKNGPIDNHAAEINKNDSKPKGTKGGGGRRRGARNNRKHHSTTKESPNRNETHTNTGGNDEHETNCKSGGRGGRARCQREAPQSIDSSSVAGGRMNTAVATHVV